MIETEETTISFSDQTLLRSQVAQRADEASLCLRGRIWLTGNLGF